MSVCLTGWLTEGPCKPLGLVIVDYGHAHSIEAHQTQNDPVEALSFHHAADEEPGPLLLPAEIGGAVHLTATFHASPAKWGAWWSCKQRWRELTGNEGSDLIFVMGCTQNLSLLFIYWTIKGVCHFVVVSQCTGKMMKTYIVHSKYFTVHCEK